MLKIKIVFALCRKKRRYRKKPASNHLTPCNTGRRTPQHCCVLARCPGAVVVGVPGGRGAD